MTIDCPDEFSKELAEQLMCDDKYGGFNNETLIFEGIKEILGIEKYEIIRVE